MTKKEAIFELIKYRRRLEEDSPIDAEPFDIAIEALERERERGKWIHYDEGDFDYDYKCSLCGYAVWDNSDYCPNCGAKMGDSNG